ncbi:hypothetical protein [uncultured Oscillibacter sp.]|uniref:hypothetical protein n=1 Tax=uncultured Oscillibacter sp. TaxID=876091 RepID=UPI00261C6E3C|nr:hypothetical protein [uncultured Oscillibacter sp.]
MFRKKEPQESRPPVSPRTRGNLYGLGALYLAYLFYQIARPYLTRDPYGPTAFQFALGAVILGGGAAALAFLAWRMYKAPLPEEEPPEEPSLPEEAAEDGEDPEDD